MRKKHLFLSIFLVLLIPLGITFVLKPTLEPVSATVSSCEASVEPTSITTNTTVGFTFTINNTSEQDIAWVRVERPSEDFILSGSASNGVFSFVDPSDEAKIYFGGSLPPGESTFVSFNVTSGDTEISSTSWGVLVSDDPSGADATSCIGNFGTEISGSPPDPTGPELSSITISNITSSSVVVSWTTNEEANSYVNYGLTNEYGSSETNETLTTSHSVSLTGLSANTTYYFYIGSTDGDGNSVESSEAAFTTASPGSTAETITITNTTTRTVTPTPTPTPIPDRTPPSIEIGTDLSKPYVNPPKITGTATDPSGVVKVEYSLDDGRNFLSVDTLSQPGAKSVKFEFTPQPLDDDNYKIRIRAQDGSPQFNTGISSQTWELIIDRLAPQVSGLLYSYGPHVLNPQPDGSIIVLEKVPFKITASAVGGPTEASILWQSEGASVSSRLSKNPDNQLWSGELSYEKGDYLAEFSARDGAGNSTLTNLNKIVAAERGLVNAKESVITIYYQDADTDKWVVWDGKPYSQENPLKTDSDGKYSLFLPAGKYYLNIQANGYQSQNTEIFSLSEPSFINAGFSLKKSKLLFGIGPLRIYFPDFSALSVPFENNLPNVTNKKNELTGKQIPYFSLGSFNPNQLKGKNSVISVFNSWSPQAGEQISLLNNFSENKNFNYVAVAEGDGISKAHIFGKRGEYKIPILPDPEARLVIPLNLNVLPVHYFMDREGKITNIRTGVLTEEEIGNLLEVN